MLCDAALQWPYVMLCCSDESQQLERLMNRNHMSEADARARISSQIPIADKKKLATHKLCLIDNSSHPEFTRRQIMSLKSYLDNSLRPEVFRASILIISTLLFAAFFGFSWWWFKHWELIFCKSIWKMYNRFVISYEF